MRGFRKLLMIGLGGSGHKMLVNLKRHLLDSSDFRNPRLPDCIKFLVLDTDDRMESAASRRDGREIQLDRGSLIYLRLVNPMDFIHNVSPGMKQMLFDESDMSINSITKGAHGIRFAGRLAFLANYKMVEDKIESVIRELNDVNLPLQMEKAGYELYGRNPEICICGSIAGGTGSGTFIDVGIMCRKIAQRVSSTTDLKITGVFLTPWVYEGYPTTQNCRANGYAAMSELDYFMNLSSCRKKGEKGKGYVAYYGEEVPVEQSPYDLFHIVDGRNEYGENRRDLQNLIDSISDAMAHQISEVGDHAGSHIDNIIGTFTQVPPDLWGNRFPHYTSFGIASLYYPAEEYHAIHSYRTALELIGEAEAFCAQMDTVQMDEIEKESLSFFDEIQLSEDHLAGFSFRLLGLTPDDADYRLSPNFDFSSKGLSNRLMSARRNHLKRMEQMLAERTTSRVPERIQDYERKLNSRLERYRGEELQGTRQRRFSLLWLERLASELACFTDLFNTKIRQCDSEISTLESEIGETLSQVQSSRYGIFRRARQNAGESYAKTISREAQLSCMRTTCEQAAQVMERLRQMVDDLLAPLRVQAAGEGTLQRNLDAIRGEFITRVKRIEQGLKRRKDNPFEVFVGNENVLYTYMRENETPSIVFEEFRNQHRLQSASDFIERQEELGSLFLDFARERWQSLRSVSIDEIIDKEEEGNPGYRTKLIRHLLRLSCALWNFDRGLITDKRQRSMYHIVVCGHADHVAGKEKYQRVFENLRNEVNMNESATFASTGDRHRIVVVQYSASLPAYALASMKEYRHEYELHLQPPTHFDRRLALCLPDLFPEQSGEDEAIRVLTVSIVPGIDVILDEKVRKGHVFTIDYPGELTYEHDPKKFMDFISLYGHLLENQETVDFLRKRIQAKFEEKGADALKPHLEKHRKALEKKLESKDISKQITARFYYREIEILDELLKSIKRGKGLEGFFVFGE